MERNLAPVLGIQRAGIMFVMMFMKGVRMMPCRRDSLYRLLLSLQ